MAEGITFEEYLGVVKPSEVNIVYGDSEVYTLEELEEADVQIQCRFASWEGCELHTLTYAGDEAITEENLAWMNELSDGPVYTQCCEFLMNFHSPAEGGGAWNPDFEYTDYQWWLARTEDGGWDILTFGY